MERHEVDSLFRERLERYIEERDCPACKSSSLMIHFHADPLEGDCEYKDKYRCLNCLALLEESLTEIKS